LATAQAWNSVNPTHLIKDCDVAEVIKNILFLCGARHRRNLLQYAPSIVTVPLTLSVVMSREDAIAATAGFIAAATSAYTTPQFAKDYAFAGAVVTVAAPTQVTYAFLLLLVLHSLLVQTYYSF